MIRIILGLCLFVSAGTSQANGAISVKEALEIKQQLSSGGFTQRAQWNALTIYLQGTIEGAMTYHKNVLESGGTPIFCPPKKKGYSIQEFVKIMEQAPKAQAQDAAIDVILRAYWETYPC